MNANVHVLLFCVLYKMSNSLATMSFVSEIYLLLLLQLIDAWKLTLKQLVTYVNILMN